MVFGTCFAVDEAADEGNGLRLGFQLLLKRARWDSVVPSPRWDSRQMQVVDHGENPLIRESYQPATLRWRGRRLAGWRVQ